MEDFASHIVKFEPIKADSWELHNNCICTDLLSESLYYGTQPRQVFLLQDRNWADISPEAG